jgi:hypothetical protein
MLFQNNYPISADDMIYNKDRHMYILQADYVKQNTGIDLSLMVNSPYIVDKTTAVNNILADISEQVYLYVYGHNMRYKDYIEYLMAKSPKAREIIRAALMKQLSYIVRNGKINEFVGINVSYNANNAYTPIEELRGDRAIHPEAIAILSEPIEDGLKLLYSGNYYLPNRIGYRVGY